MTRRVRTTTQRDLTQISVAIRYGKDARAALRRAGANQAARYMARALKSAEGAQRHAINAQYRRVER